MLNHARNHKIVLLLFSGIIFLRLWNIPQYFVFDIDVQYQALLAWEQIQNFHVIWIGVSASNLGYYLGPGLVYLTALLLKISGGDPLILGYFASLVGIATAGSLFYVARQLFNEKIALIALTLYGFSHYLITYDRRFWPIFIPFIAIWIYYSIVKSQKNMWWLAVSIFLISASYHIHLSLLIFWPFILFSAYQKKGKLNFKFVATLIGIYFLITSPLLVFDTLHNYDNLRLPWKIISSQSEGTATFQIPKSFDYLQNIISKVFVYQPTSDSTPSFTFAGILFLLIIQSKKWKKLSEAHKYLIAIIGLQFVAVLLYPGPLQEYYGVLFAPFVILIVSHGITKIVPKYTFLFLALYSVLNLYSFFTLSTETGITSKKAFIQKVMEKIDNREYELTFDGDRDHNGWRYLFQAYGKKPVSSSTDEQFGWIYQEDISSDSSLQVYVGDKTPEKFISKVSEGLYNAFIIEK